MGRKSTSKSHAAPPAAPPTEPKGSSTTIVVVAVMAVVLAAAAFAYLRQVDAVSQTPAAATTPAAPVLTSSATAPGIVLKPHVQQNLPPLQFPGYPTQRSPEVIRAAYKFAAEHPEVLTYVPCFCGCERSGHRGNEDCFVRERAVNGDVISWEEHGMECAVCIDVAQRSLQLFTSGQSVADIRATIEREWAGKMPSHTPTPAAPPAPAAPPSH